MLSPFQCDFLATVLGQEAISPKQARLIDEFLAELAPFKPDPKQRRSTFRVVGGTDYERAA